MSIIEKNVYTAMKPLKCHTQWTKSAFIRATMKEIWSFEIFQYISNGEAI